MQNYPRILSNKTLDMVVKSVRNSLQTWPLGLDNEELDSSYLNAQPNHIYGIAFPAKGCKTNRIDKRVDGVGQLAHKHQSGIPLRVNGIRQDLDRVGEDESAPGPLPDQA